MLLADLVETSGRVAATPARSKKVAAIADLLRDADPDDVEIATSFLTGEPRQGRIGVGWANVARAVVTAAGEPTLMLGDVDAAFTSLAGTSGSGSVARRGEVLERLLNRATAAEAEFLRRVLTGELRQGALAGIVADAVAKATGVPLAVLRRGVMLAGDLAGVARIASAGGEPAVAAIGLEVLRPVLPMLASTADDVAAALVLTGEASVEWKLDGARVQVHRLGDDVRIYTRNLNDITVRLPGVAAAVLALPARRMILDGEVVGYDEAGAAPERFQDTMSRFGRQDGVAGNTLEARFFDVLHVDGDDLIDRPLRERIAVLDAVAGPLRIPGRVTADADEAQAVLTAALAAGHEGVMVKALDSAYEAGRRGGAWRKVKPVLTLDLVVLAAEWGHGRRRGWLSNIHMGARDPDDPGAFVMVGKTFKGMTDALLAWQTDRLQDIAVESGPHVVRVRPELVVEIALDGVQVSTRYPGGVALRFARLRRYRDDKGPEDADTIAAVRALLVKESGERRA